MCGVWVTDICMDTVLYYKSCTCTYVLRYNVELIDTKMVDCRTLPVTGVKPDEACELPSRILRYIGSLQGEGIFVLIFKHTA